MELTGRVAVVTGAARGIGRAIALALGDAGASVAVFDARLEPFTGERYHRLPSRTSGPEEDTTTVADLQARGGQAVDFEVDVADAEAVEAAVDQVAVELGPVDVLVNNAGITTNFVSLARTTPADWQRELSVNLSGAFHCIRAVVPAMAERGWGRVVSISSVAAKTPGRHPTYAASKAGILGLTRAVAKEYAATGVTVNAIMPGLIATPLVTAMGPEEEIAGLVPAKRCGQPEEIAAAVRFLVSPDAGYITGVDLAVDGGLLLGIPM